MESSPKTLIVIVGPTASGKTDIAISLAQRFGTEIISADSRQLFKEMTIGTAKPTAEQLAKVQHHFINYISVEENFDAGKFGREGLLVVNDLFKKYSRAILCGGSGLYIKAICDGFDEMPDIHPSTRKRIIDAYQSNGIGWLQKEVEEKDPDYFGQVDVHNPQRLMRALELIETTGQGVLNLRKKSRLLHEFNIVKIGLEVEREELYARINNRVDDMVESGLVDEVKSLYPKRELNALQTVGYQEIFGYLDGEYDLDTAISLLKRNTRRYAKRQMTWFKKDKTIKWFSPNEVSSIINYLEKF